MTRATPHSSPPITETLEAMLQQESVYYTPSSTNTIPSFNHLVTCLEHVQELCRLRHRETLVIATSYLHRYLQVTTINTPPPSNLRQIALVCFYMACKIHEPAALPLRTLNDLYQRFLLSKDEDEINTSSVSWELLELNVAEALRWRLHPPMAMAFVDQFLTDIDEPRRLRKRAQACLEASFRANPVQWCQHRASSLAMAALILAERDTSHFAPSEALRKALTFLKKRVNNNSVNTTATSLCPAPKKNRKRCVTPTPPFAEDNEPRSRKRSKTHTMSPCLISTRSSLCLNSTASQQPIPPPCQIWSPRPAVSMAE